MDPVKSRSIVFVCCAAMLVASCGSSKKHASSSTTTTVKPSASAPGSSTASSTPTAVTDVFPTTPLPCQPIPFPTTPVVSPSPSSSVSLTKIDVLADQHCVDHVVFSFTSNGPNPPGYTITYATPPFVADASGAPVAVTGKAFISVRISPGYGFDPESGAVTYKGSANITPATAYHVRNVVRTGDNEGVMTWVIGLDSKRPFVVQATGKPQTQLVVTIA